MEGGKSMAKGNRFEGILDQQPKDPNTPNSPAGDLPGSKVPVEAWNTPEQGSEPLKRLNVEIR
jgi:hypothetical protein